MLDTKGPEVRSGDLTEPVQLAAGDEWTFTTQLGVRGENRSVSVNYEGFTSDVSEGDTLLVDGGLLSFRVLSVKGRDVVCRCVEGGELGGRRHLNVRGKSASLPSITDKDWEDIAFGLHHGVDYFALSFVKNADVVLQLKAHCAERGLILVDTKYEFGRLPASQGGGIVVIDEVHTPDSSRFWFAESYAERHARGEEPESFDKEYVRRWLAAVGFTGDGPIPPLPDDVRVEAARRYVEAYERITGTPFVADLRDPGPRIEAALAAAIP